MPILAWSAAVSGDSTDSLKHRHDIGHPEHGARSTELVTRGIQLALGAAILGTLALILYLVVARGGAS